jgi:hypothetical protein
MGSSSALFYLGAAARFECGNPVFAIGIVWIYVLALYSVPRYAMC